MVDNRCESLQGSSSCIGSEGRQSSHGQDKRGLNTNLHLTVAGRGLPLRVHVTSGIVADCIQSLALIEGFSAECLVADRGYDTNTIIKGASRAGIKVVIPPKKNRKDQGEYDKEVYRVRHLVENAFLHLKCWRGIATWYAKNVLSFASSVHIRCISIWLRVLRAVVS